MSKFPPRMIVVVAMLAAVGACGKSKLVDETENLPAATLLARAKAAVDDKRYEEALELYGKVESRFPYGMPAEQAQLSIAYVYYKSEQPELAVTAADRFIKLHPTHPRVDYAYYLKGISSYRERTGAFARITGSDDLSDRDPQPAREAHAVFRELVTRFPASPYGADARQRMVHLVNVLARHDVNVARYYLSRGAYVAVVNRTKKVIEQYNRAPVVEDALGLMAIAYREMGIEDLMAATVRVLRHNFPHSDYLKQL